MKVPCKCRTYDPPEMVRINKALWMCQFCGRLAMVAQMNWHGQEFLIVYFKPEDPWGAGIVT